MAGAALYRAQLQVQEVQAHLDQTTGCLTTLNTWKIWLSPRTGHLNIFYVPDFIKGLGPNFLVSSFVRHPVHVNEVIMAEEAGGAPGTPWAAG